MTKVTSVTSSKPLHNRCSRCKRPNGTTFRKCERCLERARKRMQKRLNATPVCPPGQRYCGNCGHIQPEDQFKSSVARRQTLTKKCQTCRQILARSEINPTTAKGKCKARWEEWKAKNPCVVCGESDPQLIEADHLRDKVHRCSESDPQLIEADHLRDKVHRCSDDRYWSCHGGVPALTSELTKCQSLCCWCHRLKSDRERGTTKKKCVLKRRAIINAEKMRRGKCLRCPRRVTLETCCAFDFDHRDASTKVINLCNIVKKSQAFFDQHIVSELKACDMLCCSCHKKVTIARKNDR
jgi:hypothetical protein